jgi:putative membrane protein
MAVLTAGAMFSAAATGAGNGGGNAGGNGDGAAGTRASAGPHKGAPAEAGGSAAATAEGATRPLHAPGGVTVLTDPQIVTVLHVAHRREIEKAQIALTRAVNTEVREFANTIITDHTAADAALATLVVSPSGAGRLRAVESPISRTLVQTGKFEQSALQSKTGVPFDLAYVSWRVASNSEILQLIDSVLLPTAQSTALRRQLAQARTIVANHMQTAVHALNEIAAPELSARSTRLTVVPAPAGLAKPKAAADDEDDEDE